VDNAAAGGHFARFGEHPAQHLGLHAGEHRGIRRVVSGE
jgi:hypothetical protein